MKSFMDWKCYHRSYFAEFTLSEVISNLSFVPSPKPPKSPLPAIIYQQRDIDMLLVHESHHHFIASKRSLFFSSVASSNRIGRRKVVWQFHLKPFVAKTSKTLQNAKNLPSQVVISLDNSKQIANITVFILLEDFKTKNKATMKISDLLHLKQVHS